MVEELTSRLGEVEGGGRHDVVHCNTVNNLQTINYLTLPFNPERPYEIHENYYLLHPVYFLSPGQ